MAKRVAASARARVAAGGDPRAAAIKFLTEQIPTAFVSTDAPVETERISTGSLAIDHITGGGFPRGKVAELFGPPGSGKTTLAATCCAKAQASGLYPVYIDLENGLDRPYAEKIGFDVSAALTGQNGLYIMPRTFEETLTILQTMVEDAQADIVFVDSVAGLVPEAAFNLKITEIGQLGQQARLMSAALPKMAHILRDRRTSLVFVNQVRANIDTSWTPNPGARPQTKSQGGWALYHWSAMRLELKQKTRVAKYIERASLTDPKARPDKIPTASLHSAHTFKNKTNAPYQTIEFFIRYDQASDAWGIDNLQTLIDIARQKGVIEAKGGGYFLYKGAEEMNVRTEAAIYEWFATHPAAIAELRVVLEM